MLTLSGMRRFYQSRVHIEMPKTARTRRALKCAHHAFDRHRYWLTGTELSKKPSEYFREHIYVTFQDDWVAFQMKDMCNMERIMWANDFPHSDSTWPWSQELLAEHTKHLNEDETNLILHDNVCDLYGLTVN